MEEGSGQCHFKCICGLCMQISALTDGSICLFPPGLYIPLQILELKKNARCFAAIFFPLRIWTLQT